MAAPLLDKHRTARYIVLAVQGGDMKVYGHHFRKTELEQMAKDTGADLVYLEPMPEEERGSKNPEGDAGP